MALHWEWSDKMGIAMHDGKQVNIYRGNAFMIGLNQWTDLEDGEEYWSMAWFFADKNHCKSCLGLDKDGDGCDFGWDYLELDMKYKESFEFASLLAKAKKKGRYKDVRVILY